jgi:TPP-dependent pyruvate/acetoin dehydrogenase alpha subunit
MIEHQLVAAETVEILDQQVVHEVNESVAFARASADPDLAILYQDMWV